MKRLLFAFGLAGAAALAGALVLTGAGDGATAQHAVRWPGGCAIAPSKVANPTDRRLWRASVVYLSGRPTAYWLIPNGCAWLRYPAQTSEQLADDWVGAPTLTWRFGGRLYRSTVPLSADGKGLQSSNGGIEPTQEFTVAWPYAELRTCEYLGQLKDKQGVSHPAYGHYSVWTYNARGAGHWDRVTDESHPCP